MGWLFKSREEKAEEERLRRNMQARQEHDRRERERISCLSAQFGMPEKDLVEIEARLDLKWKDLASSAFAELLTQVSFHKHPECERIVKVYALKLCDKVRAYDPEAFFMYPHKCDVTQAPSPMEFLDKCDRAIVEHLLSVSDSDPSRAPFTHLLDILQNDKQSFWWRIVLLARMQHIDLLAPYVPSDIADPCRVAYELVSSSTLHLATRLEHEGRIIELVYLLEGIGQAARALDLLKALGPMNYEEFDYLGRKKRWKKGYHFTTSSGALPVDQAGAYEKHVKKLEARALLGSSVKDSVPPTAEEMEQDYALGKITKEEFDGLRAKLVQADQSLCPSCKKPVERGFRFCPFCGVKC